jgi:hypothetical protein
MALTDYFDKKRIATIMAKILFQLKKLEYVCTINDIINQKRIKWLTKLVKIVLLAEHALMNVRLRQYQKVTFIRLIRMFAQIAVHAPMYVRLKQFIPPNSIAIKGFKKGPNRLLFYWGLYFAI